MNKKERKFVDTVWSYYQSAGRHKLPWRQNHNPYNILVSELMLQQTQVERVIPKYESFIAKWPTVQALARASLGDVLLAWQGLGYNRRAKFLHVCAQTIVADYDGVFPTEKTALEKLPGIGPYTAGALCAFAYNQSVVLIETNVRRVFLHHFFPEQHDISDTDIFPYIQKTLPVENSRDWYAALMDYGTYLKKTISNPNVRSKQYIKQSKFAGSDRQIRGAILKLFVQHTHITETKITSLLDSFSHERIMTQLDKLCAEGLLQKKNRTFYLPSN